MKCISITDFHYKKISYIIPTRIEIIHGSHSLYPVLSWVTLCSLHFIPRFRLELNAYEEYVTHVKTGYKLWLP
jgi:hypothetical protein